MPIAKVVRFFERVRAAKRMVSKNVLWVFCRAPFCSKGVTLPYAKSEQKVELQVKEDARGRGY